MSKGFIQSISDINLSSTPPAGTALVGVDVDNLLKMKLADGSIVVVGSAGTMSLVVGATGSQGYQGPQGVQGDQGPAGSGGGGGSFSLPITTFLGSGTASYNQAGNFLGLGLTAAGQTWDTGSGGINIIGSIDATPFGGSPDTTFVGYLNPVGNAQATLQTSYKPTGDTEIQLGARSVSNDQAGINIKGYVGTASIEFNFSDGVNYTFPNTSPSMGQVLGVSGSSTQLDWVTSSAAGSQYQIQFNNGSGGFAANSNLYYNSAIGEFRAAVFLGSTGSGAQMGDIDGVGNKTIFVVDDTGQRIYGVINKTFKITNASNRSYLWLDKDSGVFQIGDCEGSVNGTKLMIDDTSKSITIDSRNSGQTYIGDVNSGGNGMMINVNDSTQSMKFCKGINGGRYLLLDVTNGIYQIGDVDWKKNNTHIGIDDNSGLTNIQTGTFSMNGTPGVSGTYSTGDSRVVTITNGIITNIS